MPIADLFAKIVQKISTADVVDNALGSALGVFLVWLMLSPKGIIRKIIEKRKERKTAIKSSMECLTGVISSLLDLDDNIKAERVARVMKESGLISPNAHRKSGREFLVSFRDDLGRCRYPRKLRSVADINDACELLQRFTKLSGRDRTKARTFINTCGEKIKEGYEIAVGDNRFSDLESELISRIKEGVQKWNQHLTDSGYERFRILMIGGMRVDVAIEIFDQIQKTVGLPVQIGLYRPSVSKEFIQGIKGFAISNPQKITVREVADETDARTGYEIIISSHYWQHRNSSDLIGMRFHLRPAGLLIWLSASSRGYKDGDVEFVCEGFPPLEPNPTQCPEKTTHDSTAGQKKTYGSAIPYTRMGVYSADKAWIKYERLGAELCGNRFFYDQHFPRSFIANQEDLIGGFEAVTAKFLIWYFSGSDVVSNIDVSKIDSFAAKEDARKRFGDDQYVICSVSYNRHGEKENERQYFVAVIGIVQNGDKRIVTLYPCVQSDDVAEGEIALSHRKIAAYLNDGKKSDQHIERDRSYVECDDESQVFRVVNRIQCPVAKHYLIVLAKSASNEESASSKCLYCACIPSRTYLTEEGYEIAREMLVKYDSRIAEFCAKNTEQHFLPYRVDSVTILLPYIRIKKLMRELFSIEVDDEQTFFHKCYGRLDFPGCQPVLHRTIEEQERAILEEDLASIEKDRAFNKISIQDRLKMLGCMNAHDVLLFGIKQGCD